MADQLPDEMAGEPLRWEPMVLAYIGHIADTLRHGHGKISPIGGDTGEPRKQVPAAG